jgi:alkanesulfonate monooxygenase SsuD/methylene tetrahydromethanopterin reductase-like flavin-dependent oxidoreductase (luciferase family)
MRDDLQQLREQFPGWQFGSVWASAGSGPDARRLYAQRNGVLITAWEAPELAANIRHEEQAD